MFAWQAQASAHPLIWAALVSLLAIGVKAAINAVAHDDVGFLPYVVAVGLAAWLGSLRGGLGATMFCLGGDVFLFIPPIGQPVITDSLEVVQAGLFVVTGVLMSALSAALHAARRESERSRRRAESLQQLAVALGRVEGIRDTANAVLELSESILGASAAAVTLHSAGLNVLELAADVGFRAPLRDAYASIPVDGDLPEAEALRTNRAVLLSSQSVIRQRFARDVADAMGDVRSVACLPLGLREQPIGVLTLAFEERNRFSIEEVEFLSAIADTSAQALARAALSTERQSTERRLALVAEASDLLGASFDYQAALPRLARLLAEGLADRAVIEWLEPDGTYRADARRQGESSAGPKLVGQRDRIEPPRRATLVDAPDSAESGGADVLARLGGNSAVLAPIPIEARRDAEGVLVLSSTEAHAFGAADVAFAADLGRRIGVTIQTGSLLREATQFTATVDASLDAVLLIDPESLRIRYANEGALAQLGYTRAELIDMPALAIKPKFDEASYRELLAPLLAGRRAARTYPTTHRRKDGVEVPVEVFMQCVTLPDGERRIIVSARDISERIEIQSRLYRLATAERARGAELRAIIESMREAVLVCNDAGDVILRNQALIELLGEPIAHFNELGPLLGDFEGELPPLGRASGPSEIRTEQPLRWLEASGYRAEPTGEGDASGSTVLLLRDVTEQRQAQLAQEAFMGILSHELRTPVTTIFGITKILRRRRGSETSEAEELLGDVEAESERLYRLVEDLLVLSRSQAGRISLELEPVLLQHVARTIVDSERRATPEVTFVERVARDLPPISGDRTYVEQIVRNLVGNAVKYGPESGGTVIVEAEAAGDEVLIRVLDEGQGIGDKEDTGELFELFYRSPSTARSKPGAGIGLYVCRILTEAMGGRIWASRRPEGGSEFGFALPLFEERQREEPVSAAIVG